MQRVVVVLCVNRAMETDVDIPHSRSQALSSLGGDLGDSGSQAKGGQSVMVAPTGREPAGHLDQPSIICSSTSTVLSDTQQQSLSDGRAHKSDSK